MEGDVNDLQKRIRSRRLREEKLLKQSENQANALREALEKQRDLETRKLASSKVSAGRKQLRSDDKKTKEESKKESSIDVAISSLSIGEASALDVSTTGQYSSKVDTLQPLLLAIKEDQRLTPKELHKHINTAWEVVLPIVQIVKYFTLTTTHHLHTLDFRQPAALDAVRIIFLLNKHHRHIQERITSLSPGQTLTTFCSHTDTTREWLQFVLNTSSVLVSCEPASQARALLDLAERRLLKLKPRPMYYRELAQAYVSSRESLQTDVVGEVSTGATRAFEWYTADCRSQNAMVLVQLDRLHGCSEYFWLTLAEGQSCEAIEDLSSALAECAEYRVALVDGRVVGGGGSRAQLQAALEYAKREMNNHGVDVAGSPQSSCLRAKSLQLLGFEFNAKEIFRVSD